MLTQGKTLTSCKIHAQGSHLPATSATNHGHAIHTLSSLPHATRNTLCQENPVPIKMAHLSMAYNQASLAQMAKTCSDDCYQRYCPGFLSSRQMLDMHIYCTLFLPHSANCNLECVRTRQRPITIMLLHSHKKPTALHGDQRAEAMKVSDGAPRLRPSSRLPAPVHTSCITA